MASQQRIEDLNKFYRQTKEHLEHLEKRRDELLSWQSNGFFNFENDGEDLLPTLAGEAGNNVQAYKKILAVIESLRDRAMAGEDV